MIDDRIPHAGQPAVAQARCETQPPCRILVVDDDIDICQINRKLLVSSGYQVDAFEDGAAAWEALQMQAYDLLITDNNMPRLTGVELVKKVRAARMTLPVILASGVMPEAELNRNPSLQLSATLLKPYTGDELLGTVKTVLHTTDSADSHIESLPNNESQRQAIRLSL